MPARIENDNGLLVRVYDNGKKELVSHLMDFGERGIFEPNGKIDIDSETAKTHNRVLDEALIKGLDDNCQVGQGGYFYLSSGDIKTFSGLMVAAKPRIAGRVITFARNGKVYRGHKRNDRDCFDFVRIK